ncbi:MAG: hypothetical protein ACXABY_36610, partial [Candidatus Thorarchaeota archaeon]
SDFSVDRGSFTISGTSSSATDTLTASVTTTSAFSIANAESGVGNSVWLNGTGRVDLQDADTIRIRRGDGGSPTTGTITLEWQVVEFTGSENVQRGEFIITAKGDTDTITIVDTSTTSIFSPMMLGRGEGNSTDTADMGQICSFYDLQTSTTARGRVETNSTAGSWSYEVVEWGASGAEPPPARRRRKLLLIR